MTHIENSRVSIQRTPATSPARPRRPSQPSRDSTQEGVHTVAYPNPGPPARITAPVPPRQRKPDAFQHNLRDIVLRFAKLDLASGNFDAVVRGTNLLLGHMFPTDSELLLLRAAAHTAKGNLDAASRDYGTCLRHNPGNNEALDKLLDIALSASHSRGAL